MVKKIPQNQNVLEAACSRIEWAFETFPCVCISFSGGKDSTVLLHLAAKIAKKCGKKLTILFIDWEVQFSYTIEHVLRMKEMYEEVTEVFYWVALPLMTVSGVSQFQPEWIAWESGKNWVRNPPADAITDHDFFPFYSCGMTFEEFVPAFSTWLSSGQGLITLTGVRADESLQRMNALASRYKNRYASDKPWTTVATTGNWSTGTPLYDWKARDIWIYHAKSGAVCNPLYDLMYRAGVPLKYMRVCEPFGPEQRQGLWLYHVLEPDTWFRVCSRVSGANTGAVYANQRGEFFSRNIRLTKPEHLTWREYVMFLLNSMPAGTAEQYRTKIAIYLRWYQTRGYANSIPDEQENDLGSKDIPSWRRICKTIIKNDYWCKTLSFSPNKPGNHTKYMLRMKAKRKAWGSI